MRPQGMPKRRMLPAHYKELSVSKPRVDLFGAVHKGLRREIYATATVLEGANFADDAGKAAAAVALKTTLAFLDEHILHEGNHIAPKVKAVAPDLIPSVKEDHDEHLETSKELLALLAAVVGESGPVALGTGVKISQLFNTVVADQVAHMHFEETKINEALFANYTDEELTEIRVAIQTAIGPQRFGDWMTLMLPALNFAELVGMLGTMKATAPAPVFEGVSAIAAKVVKDWARVEAAIR